VLASESCASSTKPSTGDHTEFDGMLHNRESCSDRCHHPGGTMCHVGPFELQP
jgi:hypothetical protein